MKNKIEITDYASFMKAKAQLKADIEFHRMSIKADIEEATEKFRPVNLAKGLGEKISDFAEKMMESKLGDQVNSILSAASFVRDLFKKKDKEEENVTDQK